MKSQLKIQVRELCFEHIGSAFGGLNIPKWWRCQTSGKVSLMFYNSIIGHKWETCKSPCFCIFVEVRNWILFYCIHRASIRVLGFADMVPMLQIGCYNTHCLELFGAISRVKAICIFWFILEAMLVNLLLSRVILHWSPQGALKSSGPEYCFGY